METKKHKEHLLTCTCGQVYQFTDIQWVDFDCGMMGFFNCLKCKKVLLPSHLVKEPKPKVKIIEVDGEDKGWT